MKVLRYALSVPLIVIGALFALYGVFLLTYGGDGSGRTYIKIAGSQMDAHLAGGISLAVAAALTASGIAASRRGRRTSG
jgi:hypothetical protein